MLFVEVALWSTPMLLALLLARRAPAGERGAWWLISAGCAVIVLDKCVDLQVPLYHLGQHFVHTLDPVLRMRDEHLWMRYGLLGGLFVAGCTGFFFFLRWDRALSPAKGIALLGLTMVMAYLGIRLVPTISEHLTEPRRLAVEAFCLAIVLAGLGMGWRDAGRDRKGSPQTTD